MHPKTKRSFRFGADKGLLSETLCLNSGSIRGTPPICVVCDGSGARGRAIIAHRSKQPL